MDKIAFWCFFIAGILPIICAGISKSTRVYDNNNPRKWLAKQTGFRERANSAQRNSWESFMWFSTSLILALLFSPEKVDFVNLMSVVYILIRICYVLFYVFGFSNLRTIFWLSGQGCIFAILFSVL